MRTYEAPETPWANLHTLGKGDREWRSWTGDLVMDWGGVSGLGQEGWSLGLRPGVWGWIRVLAWRSLHWDFEAGGYSGGLVDAGGGGKSHHCSYCIKQPGTSKHAKISYGKCMDNRWKQCGTSNENEWNIYGKIWQNYGKSMNNQRNNNGNTIITVWHRMITSKRVKKIETVEQ